MLRFIFVHFGDKYKYERPLPSFSSKRYLALEPFTHFDLGYRAIAHPDPRSLVLP